METKVKEINVNSKTEELLKEIGIDGLENSAYNLRQNGGCAAAPGAAAVDILSFCVKQKKAAVRMIGGQFNAVLTEQLLQQLTAQLAQIACHDQIVKFGTASRIGEMGFQCFVCSGSHGSAHIVCICDAFIYDFSDGHVGNIRSRTLCAQNGSS